MLAAGALVAVLPVAAVRAVVAQLGISVSRTAPVAERGKGGGPPFRYLVRRGAIRKVRDFSWPRRPYFTT